MGYAGSAVEVGRIDLLVAVGAAQTEQQCVRRRSIEALVVLAGSRRDELDLATVEVASRPAHVPEECLAVEVVGVEDDPLPVQGHARIVESVCMRTVRIDPSMTPDWS